MKEFAKQLCRQVDEASEHWRNVAESAAARRPGTGGWSAKEVLGHLIDSAFVNHERFVRALTRRDLVFDGYDQDESVALHRYQESAWGELLELWRRANRHIAQLLAETPVSVSMRERPEHNLHEVAWQPFSRYQPATLEAFALDYAGHLEHHLAQITRLLAPAP